MSCTRCAWAPHRAANLVHAVIALHLPNSPDFSTSACAPLRMGSGTGRVAPCALQYPGSAQHLAAAGLGAENGLWRAVHDFCWLRATPSPNW